MTPEREVDPVALRRLAAWHRADRRPFAFRDTTDAWPVLVSEVMLQQTQAPRVEAHWRAFMTLYPTPSAFAAASMGDAVRAWQGLGYDRRAVALHRAAVLIRDRHAGVVPASIAELEALPGIGPYTARAVAAIAFARPVAGLDTNIRTVLGRALHGHGRPGDPGDPVAERILQREADSAIDPLDPRAWTLAAMDLAAKICRPRHPRCPDCPLASVCVYAALDPKATGPRDEAPDRALKPTRPTQPPFRSTNRWLRGRLVDRLRAAASGDWIRVEGPVGEHDAAAVQRALVALAGDGVIERADDGSVRLPG